MKKIYWSPNPYDFGILPYLEIQLLQSNLFSLDPTTGGWAQSSVTGAIIRNGAETLRHTGRRWPGEEGEVMDPQAKGCLREKPHGKTEKWLRPQIVLNSRLLECDSETEQDPMMLSPSPHPLPAFCLWKTLVEEEVWSEKWEHVRTKENSQRRPNNNNVVIKHIQGPWVISQGL